MSRQPYVDRTNSTTTQQQTGLQPRNNEGYSDAAYRKLTRGY